MTSIVHTVCCEFGIHPARFFGRERNGIVSRARQTAIVRLRDAGLTIAGVAAATKLSTSTVCYWLGDDHREGRKAKMRTAAQRRAQRKKDQRNDRYLHDAPPAAETPTSGADREAAEAFPG